MPQKPFDLVALDLDGTILDKQFENGFSNVVVDTIAQVQAAGIPVTIATGRVFDYVRTVAAQLAITHPVVTTQGAVVADPVSGEVIFEALLPDDAAIRAAQWVDEAGPVTVFYLSNGNGGVQIYQNREEREPEHYDHWLGSPRLLIPRFTDLLNGGREQTAFKFIVINSLSDENDLTPVLQEILGPTLQITRSHDLFVEGTAAGVDKGQGLLHLLDHLQIDPARVMAIGDNENDIPMLEAVGFAVAMGQASAKVKAAADWIAPAIHEDGAAVALRKFVLDRLER